MRIRHMAAAAVVIGLVAALLFFATESAVLAQVPSYGFHHAAIVLAVGLDALRVQHDAIKAAAAAKIAEVKDGMAADDVKRIEGEHQVLLADLKSVSDAISAETAALGKQKPWAAGFYASAAETGLTLSDLNKIVADSDTHDKAKDALIAAMAMKNKDKPGPGGAPATVAADARDKFVEGVTRSLMAKTPILSGDKSAEINEFSSLDLMAIVRECNARAGIKLMTRDPFEIVSAALQPVMASGMHSTSDFVNVLGNIANKSMLKGYEESEETFAKWTGKGNLSDFKIATRVDLGLFGNLDKVDEGAEYKFGTLSDRKDTVALATYGKMFSITRQAIINDDLNAFTKVPARMGRAAKRTIGNLVYAILTSNPTMPDGVTLFHTASHGNYVEGAGTVLGVDTLDTARSSMAKQKDPDSVATALNIRPKWLIVPVALEGKARQLVASATEPGQSNPNLANRVAALAEVVAEARLDANSLTAWYLAASASQHETIEVLYLNGIETPTLEQRVGWSVDGVEYKVRIDTGVKCWDHRTLYKSKGAA